MIKYVENEILDRKSKVLAFCDIYKFFFPLCKLLLKICGRSEGAAV